MKNKFYQLLLSFLKHLRIYTYWAHLWVDITSKVYRFSFPCFPFSLLVSQKVKDCPHCCLWGWRMSHPLLLNPGSVLQSTGMVSKASVFQASLQDKYMGISVGRTYAVPIFSPPLPKGADTQRLWRPPLKCRGESGCLCPSDHQGGHLETFPWLLLSPFKPGNWRPFISFTL